MKPSVGHILHKVSRANASTLAKGYRIPSLREPWGTSSALGTAAAPALKSAAPVRLFDCRVSFSNELRIATERSLGGFSTLGVAINAAPRNESGFPAGISHFMTKLAFGRTVKNGFFIQLNSAPSQLWNTEPVPTCCPFLSNPVRSLTAKQAKCVDTMLDLLSDCVLRPLIDEEEVELARRSVIGEIDALELKPDPAPILTELLHQAAFGKNRTLGHSQYCERSSVDCMEPKQFNRFLSSLYRNERMTVCCVGNVDHTEFVEKTSRAFEKEPSFKRLAQTDQVDSEAEWNPSLVAVEKDLSNVSLGPTPMPELVHLNIGFRSPSFNQPDHITACVLQSLMGGGGSFSAGGPGKGMYSRLYLRVLNNAVCTNLSYSDMGLFSIYTSCFPAYANHMANIAVNEMLALTESISAEEIQRAKNQLKSSLLMNLEQRSVAFEDICRQVLGIGRRENPIDLCDRIDQVSEKDLHKLAVRMLSSKPAVAAYGNVKELPDFDFFKTNLRPPRFRRFFM